MRFFRSTCASLALLLPVVLHAATPSSAADSAPSDPSQLTASFSVDASTTVPGKVLKPGSYTIRVVDHLSDRIVLRIEDPEGKAATTFLGLPASGLAASGSGPVSWPTAPKSGRALRGFAFPGGSSVEFVYPKDEAVAIAKVNSSKVAAIDPSSDNLPAHKDLSRDDMQMVTLWALSATHVGPNEQPAIQAEHYKSTETVAAASQVPAATPAPTANSAPVATPARGYVASAKPAVMPRVSARPAPAPQQVAALHRPAVVASLPHTASTLPSVLLASILCVVGAAGLRFRRLMV